ncbi:hypothetical protein PR048_010178 [Dryococelus australis]|uniref:Uncharacterized protein n=1 Tax=Dryococelus australis TaxID=614101 RepID=A0ABQ9I200_9NEOP|nr:hypothetical protein PR048_010178 [Dryococelus australis]
MASLPAAQHSGEYFAACVANRTRDPFQGLGVANQRISMPTSEEKPRHFSSIHVPILCAVPRESCPFEVSWCLFTTVHSRCTQQEPITTAESRETGCIPTTHNEPTTDPLHTSSADLPDCRWTLDEADCLGQKRCVRNETRQAETLDRHVKLTDYRSSYFAHLANVTLTHKSFLKNCQGRTKPRDFISSSGIKAVQCWEWEAGYRADDISIFPGEILVAVNIEVLRADDGEESSIILHDSHMPKNGSDPAENQTRFAEGSKHGLYSTCMHEVMCLFSLGKTHATYTDNPVRVSKSLVAEDCSQNILRMKNNGIRHLEGIAILTIPGVEFKACLGLVNETEVSMEQRCNAGEGETGDLRESLPNSGIVRHDTNMQRSGSDPAGSRACAPSNCSICLGDEFNKASNRLTHLMPGCTKSFPDPISNDPSPETGSRSGMANCAPRWSCGHDRNTLLEPVARGRHDAQDLVDHHEVHRGNCLTCVECPIRLDSGRSSSSDAHLTASCDCRRAMVVGTSSAFWLSGTSSPVGVEAATDILPVVSLAYIMLPQPHYSSGRDLAMALEVTWATPRRMVCCHMSHVYRRLGIMVKDWHFDSPTVCSLGHATSGPTICEHPHQCSIPTGQRSSSHPTPAQERALKPRILCYGQSDPHIYLELKMLGIRFTADTIRDPYNSIRDVWQNVFANMAARHHTESLNAIHTRADASMSPLTWNDAEQLEADMGVFLPENNKNDNYVIVIS